MSLKFEYDGEPVNLLSKYLPTSGEVTTTIEGALTDEGVRYLEQFQPQPREFRFTFGDVVAKDIHRGRRVDLTFQVDGVDFSWRTRVKFRRLRTLVLIEER